MPIFSAANSTQFPEDDRYVPVTEIHPASAPEYAFYFYAEDNFREKYNFDDCRDFYSFNRGLKYTDIDFNHQDLYYRRLFRLKNVAQPPKYYLCPWLIVPFEAVTSSSTTTSTPKLSSLQLVVKPYSVYDRQNSRKIKDRIIRNNANPATARTLKLFSSGNGVDASWKNPKPGSATTIIDELACLSAQSINITIDSVATMYDYSSYIEIRTDIDVSTNSYVTLGRVYLVFLKMIKRNVIFFDVKATPNSQSKIDIKILGSTGPTQSPELQDKLNDLNHVYEMSGLRYEAPNVSISLANIASPFVTGGTITFDTGATLNMHDSGQGPKIARTFKKQIREINGAPWNENINEYLFVFLIPEISPPAHSFAADPESAGVTGGITTPWFRAPCVYTYKRKFLTHEAAHGLGIPHSFYDTMPTYSAISASAEGSAKSLAISSTEDLYLFYDEVNSIGLDSAATKRFGVKPQLTPLEKFERASKLEPMLQTRLYWIYETDNLLDYQNAAQKPESQEQLRKDQVEQVRFYA